MTIGKTHFIVRIIENGLKSHPELIVENELERESLDKPPLDLISDAFDILESGLYKIS